MTAHQLAIALVWFAFGCALGRFIVLALRWRHEAAVYRGFYLNHRCPDIRVEVDRRVPPDTVFLTDGRRIVGAIKGLGE